MYCESLDKKNLTGQKWWHGHIPCNMEPFSNQQPLLRSIFAAIFQRESHRKLSWLEGSWFRVAMATAEIYRAAGSLRRNGSMWRSSGADVFSRSSRDEDDEEALKWAALEKLPTYNRLRKGLLMGSQEEDNEKFLLRLRNRIERVGITIPEIEVRFEHLTIDAEAFIGSRALPSFHNFMFNKIEDALTGLRILRSRRRKFTILHDVSGIIKPQRMTLLLGPPSSGKTTLLLALSGKLDPLLRLREG
ncbi:Pleiotropic drug resistance protein 1 [Vitis vinifera]|uniref:Pleiotropic drug resistance protein 1 n=1 Tax=Vitis vinifera TaxID=29760 RepID=A0A438GYR3_VITVI|nr:Pleiotropic drug resistance protein 1 [Vitis vinifera]